MQNIELLYETFCRFQAKTPLEKACSRAEGTHKWASPACFNTQQVKLKISYGIMFIGNDRKAIKVFHFGLAFGEAQFGTPCGRSPGDSRNGFKAPHLEFFEHEWKSFVRLMPHHDIKLPEVFEDRAIKHGCMRTAKQNGQVRFAPLENGGNIDREKKTATQGREAHDARTPQQQFSRHALIQH